MKPRPLLLLALLAATLAACSGDDEPKATLSEPQAGAETPAGADTGGDELAGPLPKGEQAGEGRAAGGGSAPGGDSTDGGSGRGGSGGRSGDGGSAPGRGDDSSREEPSASGGSGPGDSAESNGRAGEGERRSLTAAEEADFEAIRERVRELVRRNNARDSSICTELMTQRHVEEVTGLKGDTAVRKCRVDIGTSRATLRLEEIHGGRLAGDRALIQFTASVGSKRQRQTLRVRKLDGRWYFDGDGSRGL